MRSWIVLTGLILLGVGLAPSGATAQTLQQLRVRWDVAPPPLPGTPPPPNLFTVLDRQRLSGALPRQRARQLSSDQLVVVAVNALGEAVDTQLIPDPSLLRAEAAGPTGELSGIVLHRPDPEFLLSLADDPTITEVWLYQPRWTGTAFVLDLLGTIGLR